MVAPRGSPPLGGRCVRGDRGTGSTRASARPAAAAHSGCIRLALPQVGDAERAPFPAVVAHPGFDGAQVLTDHHPPPREWASAVPRYHDHRLVVVAARRCAAVGGAPSGDPPPAGTAADGGGSMRTPPRAAASASDQRGTAGGIGGTGARATHGSCDQSTQLVVLVRRRTGRRAPGPARPAAPGRSGAVKGYTPTARSAMIPQRHCPRRPRPSAARRQLLVELPLHPTVEIDCAPILLGELGHPSVRVAKFVRPGVPVVCRYRSATRTQCGERIQRGARAVSIGVVTPASGQPAERGTR